GAAGSSQLSVRARNVTAAMGSVLNVTSGTGDLLVNNAGVAGELGATVALTLPGITLGGTFKVRLNTGEAAVQVTPTLNVPAGPYLRVEGTGATLNLLGQRISGDFTFEQAARVDGTKVVKLA